MRQDDTKYHTLNVGALGLFILETYAPYVVQHESFPHVSLKLRQSLSRAICENWNELGEMNLELGHELDASRDDVLLLIEMIPVGLEIGNVSIGRIMHRKLCQLLIQIDFPELVDMNQLSMVQSQEQSNSASKTSPGDADIEKKEFW